MGAFIMVNGKMVNEMEVDAVSFSQEATIKETGLMIR